MNILFVIDGLHGGGAARVTTVVANELVKKGYNIAIATNLSTRSCVYQLDHNIKVFNIYGEKKYFSFINLLDHILRLRKVVNEFKPDVIIGEQENGIIYAKFATLCLGIPIIGHRHNTFKILGLSKLQRLIYNSVSTTVLLHKTDVAFVEKKITKAQAIYNPCSFDIKYVPQKEKKKIIAVVGSTKRYLDKGFDLAIDVWHTLAHQYPDWHLYIIGGGSETNEEILKQKIVDYGLVDRVTLTGFVNDIENRLHEASIFLLPSRVEGFPMVINEAISQGCACASFSLQGVMKELYSNAAVLISEDGDLDSFCYNVGRMIESFDTRETLAENAQSELKKYQPEVIVNDWIDLIDKIKR